MLLFLLLVALTTTTTTAATNNIVAAAGSCCYCRHHDEDDNHNHYHSPQPETQTAAKQRWHFGPRLDRPCSGRQAPLCNDTCEVNSYGQGSPARLQHQNTQSCLTPAVSAMTVKHLLLGIVSQSAVNISIRTNIWGEEMKYTIYACTDIRDTAVCYIPLHGIAWHDITAQYIHASSHARMQEYMHACTYITVHFVSLIFIRVITLQYSTFHYILTQARTHTHTCGSSVRIMRGWYVNQSRKDHAFCDHERL